LTRKLIAFDLLLLVIAALLAFHLRREFQAAKSRQQALLGKKMTSTPPEPLAALAKPAPVTAIMYAQVAEKNLFSKDRNSNVILDPVAPPPPKPVPPFPVARGVMLWEGVPPTVVLSEKPGATPKGYHPGDKVGEWQVLSVDHQYVVFAWDGKEFKKRLDELMDKTAIVAQAPEPAAASEPAPPPAAAPPPSQQLSAKSPEGPGMDLGSGFHACVPGDPTPSGTVVDGMRKVVNPSPFGGSFCRWEPAK